MKLTDILKDSGIEMGKVYTDKDMPPFQVNEGKKNEYASIYNMKEEMKEEKFDPKNPTINVHGLGVYNLKQLENRVQKDLVKAAGNLGGELGIKNLNYHLYSKRSPLSSKIKGLWEVYQQMETSQYKRAVTMYKRKK